VNTLTKSAFIIILFLSGSSFTYSDWGNVERFTSYADPYSPSYALNNSFSDDESMISFEKKLHSFFRQWRIKGASVSIIKEGNLIYSKGYGTINDSVMAPIQPYHTFRVASVSKLITAIAIMQLKEAGQLSLDEKVFGPNGILTDSIYANYKDPKLEDITVYHLLNHSAGWSSRIGDAMFMPDVVNRIMEEDGVASFDRICRFVLEKRRLSYKPGTRSSYSNFGYALLGKIIEKKSRQNYEQYVKNNILYPLQIFDTYMGSSMYSNGSRNEVNYFTDDHSKVISCFNFKDTVDRPYGGFDLETLGAAGGWVSSSVSLSKLMCAIDGDNSIPDILTEESIAQMIYHPSNLSPIGWKGSDKDKIWRTGTLHGTNALLVKRQDGISYVIIINTSNWKGPKFNSYLFQAMEKSLQTVENFPTLDLFSLASPKKNEQLLLKALK